MALQLHRFNDRLYGGGLWKRYSTFSTGFLKNFVITLIFEIGDNNTTIKPSKTIPADQVFTPSQIKTQIINILTCKCGCKIM